MFRYLFLTVACVLLACALPAVAATWKPLAKDANSVISVDTDSVVKDGNTRGVWARYDFFVPLHEQTGANTVNITAFHVVDCARQMAGIEREIHHALHAVNGESAPTPMTKVVRGSFNELVMKAVCTS
ncbi:surface-adhesin E family protein [Paraburkholderia adhaesiva]|uniref:surface-adhesin E family protein n=1 Tax=Paraburkholderia adhaesiva TaxID=2883244 RepID=UPI001F35DAFD|nr:surface-adhesin E family protein [Paraburkholderia adhaesiva]